MESSKEYLEGSTIHGLVYISTSTSKVLKIIWLLIIIICFISAVNIIRNSYADWDESPATSEIITHPIETLTFPEGIRKYVLKRKITLSPCNYKFLELKRAKYLYFISILYFLFLTWFLIVPLGDTVSS